MANPSLSEIVTTTLRDRSKTLSDNVTNNNALLARINKAGNRKPASGRDIIQELEYAENGTVEMYSNYDVIDTTPQDVLTALSASWTCWNPGFRSWRRAFRISWLLSFIRRAVSPPTWTGCSLLLPTIPRREPMAASTELLRPALFGGIKTTISPLKESRRRPPLSRPR